MKISRTFIRPPRIEMLPLIDIVFLLLVFFIYAMLSMAVHHGMPVELPQSGSSTADSKRSIAITIQSAGEGVLIFLEKEQVSHGELAVRLGKMGSAVSGEGNPELQIFADKSISYQELFRILDIARQAGLSTLSLQAEKEANMH